MSGPDVTASAALTAATLHLCYVGWLDFVGDPVRATTAPYSVLFSGTGDSDLDGNTFDAITPKYISVSEIHHQDQGSDTVTVSLSGLVGPDTDLLNIIGDVTKWQGRAARLWVEVLDSNYARVGNIWSYYTGTMISVGVKGSVTGQTIEVTIENYLADFSEPSNRTYLDQSKYDSGDHSAEAAIAIANGKFAGTLSDTPSTNTLAAQF